MPHLHNLPTELLIHIFSDLPISDIGSCLLTCHRFKCVIQNSCLLQYLIHTALAGVYDPLNPSGPSLPDRLLALKRWSAAWHQPDAHLQSPSRILTRKGHINEDILVRGDYLFTFDLGGRHGYRHPASYEWLDLRRPGNNWTQIQFEQNLVPLAFTHDVAQQDLFAVLFGCPETATFQLRLLSFQDGSSHPLASQPSVDIALPTKETHYIGLRACISVMGPYIIVAAGLPPECAGVDVLLVVDWRSGCVTKLRETLTRTYLTDFIVLSDDVLALVQGPGNAVELCNSQPVRHCPFRPFVFSNSHLSYHTYDSRPLV
ncbi:hypothetical protein B0F90DRAFT_567536 [Multifurca ochricompacta]|uniref:F-box domain-containing protein n=1 Tax=Multifurca ochricompacta TaxID=376703 RepID=A0AAD4M472_9AGAM|nr:hypothetical protein B0F90DRAFT_567536 [Multifurca ochricompacta]